MAVRDNRNGIPHFHIRNAVAADKRYHAFGYAGLSRQASAGKQEQPAVAFNDSILGFASRKNALHSSGSNQGSRSDAAAFNLLHAAVYRAVRVGSVNALRTRTDCRIAGYGSGIDIHLAAVKQYLFSDAVVDNVNNAAAFDNSLSRRSRNFLTAAAGNDGADTGAAVIHLLSSAGNLCPFGNPAGQNFLQAADYGRILIGTGNILTAAAQQRSLYGSTAGNDENASVDNGILCITAVVDIYGTAGING